MIHERDLHAQIAAVLSHESTLEDLKGWLDARSWNMHKDSATAAVELACDVELLFAERLDTLHDAEILDELAALIAEPSPFVPQNVCVGNDSLGTFVDGQAQVPEIWDNTCSNNRGISMETPDTHTVAIAPGDDIQAIVNAHPVGTTFLIKAGIYTDQVLPQRDGDVFIGEAGSILQGVEMPPRRKF